MTALDLNKKYVCQLVIRCWVGFPQNCNAKKRQKRTGSALGLESNLARDRCHGCDPVIRQRGTGGSDSHTGETFLFVFTGI